MDPSGTSCTPGANRHAALATMGEPGLMCATLLVFAAALLPQLQVLEITHMPLGVAGLVKAALSRFHSHAERYGLSAHKVRPLPHACTRVLWTPTHVAPDGVFASDLLWL